MAAMAYGTQTVPKVSKIFGPGNQFVTAAKMLLQNSEAMVGIDMPAGPSEVLVIADAAAPPAFVAADLLSQAEHGKDSQVREMSSRGRYTGYTSIRDEGYAANFGALWTRSTAILCRSSVYGIAQVVLVALPGVDLDAVAAEVEKQRAALPRGDIASEALGHSFVVKVDDKATAAQFSNLYAPEHLIINVEDAESWMPLIDEAGSVFLGRWTPESVGDYASGTNHVLPTYGYARMYSGVSLDSFQKHMTVQELTEDGLKLLGPSVAKMAEVEGLDAHRRAVTLRLGMRLDE